MRVRHRPWRLIFAGYGELGAGLAHDRDSRFVAFESGGAFRGGV
jgi:hypothetical protein